MSVIGIVRKGEYYDSISIMLIAKQVAAIDGVADSAVVMATKENKSVLEASGLLTPEISGAAETDLVVAFKTVDGIDVKSLAGKVDEVFCAAKKSTGGKDFHPQSIDGALKVLPDANMTMISVAGRYAGDVAMDALKHDLHVFLFSDNVPIEKEIELKQFAQRKNLFVMGPDCGTAIVNGVPLAFANVVNRGNIGIVAASGTGLQEVSCLISNAGIGISQAIGTGGRDVKEKVDGLMFLQGIRALADDDQTHVILLVSKPPDQVVLEKIIREVGSINKPVVGIFLGASSDLLKGSNIHPATTLEEAAALAVAFSKNEANVNLKKQFEARDASLRSESATLVSKLSPDQKYLRALFSGGTFCDETQLLARDCLTEIYSNIPVAKVKKLSNAWKSKKHTIIDLGDDEFTVGKPHPMIDYSTRCKRLVAEADDPETAVILLDIVLGYGSNTNPLAEILPAIENAKSIAAKAKRFLPIVASVTGTDKDPQNRSTVIAGLERAGVIVKESNAAASKLAIALVNAKETYR
jgi:FdrA protein